MKTSLIIAIAASISLHLVLAAGDEQEPTQPVKDLCNATLFPDICLREGSFTDTIKPTKLALSLSSRLKSIIEQCTKMARELVATPEFDKLKPTLETCVKKYKDAETVYTDEVTTAYSDKDFLKVMDTVLKIEDIFNDCSQSFEGNEKRMLLRQCQTYTEHLVTDIVQLYNISRSWWPNPTASPARVLAESVRCPTESLHVKAICNKSKYVDLCRAATKAVSQGSFVNGDVTKALKLTVTSTILNTQNVIEDMPYLNNSTDISEQAKKIMMTTCKYGFERAIPELEKASTLLEMYKCDGVTNNLKDIVEFYKKCDDAYSAANLTSPMHNVLLELAENNVALAEAFIK